jgi:hypothetical protein
MNEIHSPLPQPTLGDHVHLAVKAVLSALPVAGGPAAELFAAIIAPPLARRRDAWLQSVADGLDALRQKTDGFDPVSLANNSAFVSVALQASRAAIQTHQNEKLEALRNAVLNVAAGRATDEDEQAMFLGYIETLTGWHIRMLKFFEAPMRMAAACGARTDYSFAGALAQPLEEVYHDLRGRRDFYDQITRDLVARGFLNSSPDVLHTMMTGSGMSAKRTTEIADRFLAFILPPV